MITFIKEWSNQIIVSVIIATIFEMILPNGNNKKYIKMVIGIYVLFTLMQPIATILTGNELKISDFKYEQYFNSDTLETSSKDFTNNNSKLIEQAYIDNIENDIQAKMEQKGYKLSECTINIVTDENKENYGAIQKLELKLENNQNVVQTNNSIEVKQIEVGINKNKENIENSNITDSKKKEIIEYLAEEYSLEKEKIIIN